MACQYRRTFGLAAALIVRLEAEQERWFLWLPVMLGFGIALYFLLPTSPASLEVGVLDQPAGRKH